MYARKLGRTGMDLAAGNDQLRRRDQGNPYVVVVLTALDQLDAQVALHHFAEHPATDRLDNMLPAPLAVRCEGVLARYLVAGTCDSAGLLPLSHGDHVGNCRRLDFLGLFTRCG